MSKSVSVSSVAAAGFTALALAAAFLISASYVWAAETGSGAVGLCPKGDFASPVRIIKPALDQDDEDAALESVQFALSEVADGSSYVWHRSHGRLSGVVQPVKSFKDTRGAVCRYAVVVLTGVETTKRTEIVACRLPTGVWELAS
jgi:hypothetical protein